MHYYPYKITCIQDLLFADLPVRHTFSLEFLPRWKPTKNGWKALSIQEITEYGRWKIPSHSAVLFCKGMVWVDDIVYCRAIVFWGEGVLWFLLPVLLMVNTVGVICSTKSFQYFNSVQNLNRTASEALSEMIGLSVVIFKQPALQDHRTSIIVTSDCGVTIKMLRSVALLQI